MTSFNQVVLVGHLTADPELRYLPGKGTPVGEFTIGVNRTFTRENEGKAEKVEEVAFVNVTCWKRLAEVAAEFLKKGRAVLVSGHLKQDRWEDKETGQKRSKLSVVAQQLTLFPKGGSRDDEGASPSADAPAPAQDERRETSPAGPGGQGKRIFRSPSAARGSRAQR